MSKLVYVCDNMRHLVCLPYSTENLHAMASDLDIDPCWLHNGKYPHYDIPKRRIKEVQDKCHAVISARDLIRIVKGEITSL